MTLPHSRLFNLAVLGSVVLSLLLVAAVVGVAIPGSGEDVSGAALGLIIGGTGIALFMAGLLLAGLGALVIPPRRPRWTLMGVLDIFTLTGW